MRHWWRNENGAVLVSALLIVLLVTLLGTVAITESLGGSESAAVVRKHMQVAAAANAGASAAVASIESQAASVTSQTQALTCTSPTTNQYLMTTSPSGAANAASAETYNIYYNVFSSPPSTADLNDIQANPASGSGLSGFSSGGTCSSSGTSTQISPPAGVTPWYLVLASSGSTASKVYGASSGTAKTSVVDLQMNWSAASTSTTSTTTTTTPSSTTSTTAPTTTTTTAVSTGQLTTFTDALFAANTLSPGSSFCDFNRNGTNPCPGTGETYTNTQLSCTNSNNYMGDVYADDTTDADAVIGGNCYIEGNLYTPGSISVTSGGTTDMTCPAGSSGPPWWDICGNVYSTGNAGVTIGAGFTVQGSIYSDGPVNISGGSKKQNSVGGNIYSEGSVTVASGTSVGGKIYQDCTPSLCLEGGVEVADPGAFPITLPPTQSLPPYTYSANAVAWQDAGFTTLVDNLNQTCDSSNGAMPQADYTAIESMTGPSVLITNCAFVWDASENPEAGQTFALNHSLAIFASGGFNFDGTTHGTEVQGSGSPDLYAIVPWGGSPNPPPNGETTGCPSSLGSGTNPKGDVWDSATIAGANVFLYTPNNVCSSGNMSMTGQIYSGYDLTGTGTFTPNPGLALPYGILSGTTTSTTTVAPTTTTTAGSTTSTSQSTTTTTQPTTTSTTTAAGNWSVTVLSVQ